MGETTGAFFSYAVDFSLAYHKDNPRYQPFSVYEDYPGEFVRRRVVGGFGGWLWRHCGIVVASLWHGGMVASRLWHGCGALVASLERPCGHP